MTLLFVMSGQDAGQSSTLSGGVIEVLASVFKPAYEDMSVSEKVLLVEQLQGVVRKFAHYFAYCVLGVLVSAAMWTYSFSLGRKVVWSFSIGVLYAVSDEVHQYFVPGRSMQLFDVFVDSLGVLTGIVIVYIVTLLIPQKDG